MNGDHFFRRREEDSSEEDTVEMSKPARGVVAAASASDRRREERVLQQVPVTGRYGHHFISCTSADVSERGVFLRTSHPPPVGAFVQLGFAAEEGTAFVAEGHVRWVKTEDDGRTVGCGIALTTDIASTLLPH
jgi:hypothetical protein